MINNLIVIDELVKTLELLMSEDTDAIVQRANKDATELFMTAETEEQVLYFQAIFKGVSFYALEYAERITELRNIQRDEEASHSRSAEAESYDHSPIIVRYMKCLTADEQTNNQWYIDDSFDASIRIDNMRRLTFAFVIDYKFNQLYFGASICSGDNVDNEIGKSIAIERLSTMPIVVKYDNKVSLMDNVYREVESPLYDDVERWLRLVYQQIKKAQ